MTDCRPIRPQCAVGAAALALLLVVPAEASTGEPLTAETVIDLRSVLGVKISPDGETVLFSLSVPRGADEKHGSRHEELWRVPTAGGEPRPLTHAPGRSTQPAFSPDGASVAFLAKRGDDEHTQIYILPLAGGEARRLTDGPTSIAGLRWSPQGSFIAYVAPDDTSEEVKEARKAGRDWQVVGVDEKPRRLWRIEVESGTSDPVSTDDSSVWAFDWFPDGRRLVATVSARPDTDSSYIHKRVVTFAAGGSSAKTLWEALGKLGTPVVSADGRLVAVNAAVTRNDSTAGSVFVIDIRSGKATNRTVGLPATVTSVAWRGEVVAFTAQFGTTALLGSVSADTGAWREELTGPPVFTQTAVSTDGTRFALVASTPDHPAEAYVWDGEGAPRRLTFHNPELADVELGRQEVFRWTASDGVDIEGILIHPVGAGTGDRRRPVPLVSVVHGGPESCWQDGWNTSYGRWGQVLAGRGFMVLMANYRGSTGRGVGFSRADHRDLAGREFRDILDGIDALVATGLVDLARVGSGGASYGGYFSAWAATRHAERFAATVVFAGITNWISFTGTSDIPEENSIVHWDLDPYARAALVWDRSPVAHLDEGKTPVLIAHGEKDLRVPLSQGTELYTALRLRGRPVEFVTYPREPHGLRERAHQLDYMQRSIDWFERWLKPRRN